MLDFILSDEESLISLIIFGLMLLSMVWLGWFMYRAMKAKTGVAKYHKSGEYDGIIEGDGDTPFGMHIIMGLLLLFAIWYVAFGYPLDHNHSLEWYKEELAAAKAESETKFANASNEQLVRMGESVFNSQCAICHGLNGRGINGLSANLVEFGDIEHIVYVIKNGSTGLNKITTAMPPQYSLLGASDQEREVNAVNVAAYVLTLGGGVPNKGDPQQGKALFEGICAACHSPNGTGAGPTGNLPNFAADLTMYGKADYIKTIINAGKAGYIGVMPNFTETELLSDIQTTAVSKYVEQVLK